MREFTEGFYRLKRTAEPVTIGGRSRWIGYYNGVFWQLMGDETQHSTEDFAKHGTEILDRIPDEPLKIYAADFGPEGSAIAVARTMADGIRLLNDQVPAAEIKIERGHDTVSELDIEDGLVWM